MSLKTGDGSFGPLLGGPASDWEDEFVNPLQLSDADRLAVGLKPADSDERTARRMLRLDVLPVGYIDSLTADDRRSLAVGRRVKRPVKRG